MRFSFSKRLESSVFGRFVGARLARPLPGSSASRAFISGLVPGHKHASSCQVPSTSHLDGCRNFVGADRRASESRYVCAIDVRRLARPSALVPGRTFGNAAFGTGFLPCDRGRPGNSNSGCRVAGSFCVRDAFWLYVGVHLRNHRTSHRPPSGIKLRHYDLHYPFSTAARRSSAAHSAGPQRCSISRMITTSAASVGRAALRTSLSKARTFPS